MSSSRFDVAVIGSGYGGLLAALLLSARGYRAILLDRGTHPRFAIGESTTPEQNHLHRNLGKLYGLPELTRLSSYEYIKFHGIPVSVWPKESFYFLANPRAYTSVCREIVDQTSLWPQGPDYHCLRSEYDLNLLHAALARGAKFLGDFHIEKIDHVAGEFGITGTVDGKQQTVESRFLLDASGRASVLGRVLGLLDEDPAELGLRSAASFTHMSNVKLFDELPDFGLPSLPLPRSNATIHHISPDGWGWVIPFDNGVTSVGVVKNLDAKGNSEADIMENAFGRFIAGNPVFEAMVSGAEPLRPLQSTGRLQYLVTKSVGADWAILPPASGFNDPFLSPGMLMSGLGVARFMCGVDEVLRTGRPADDCLGWMDDRFQLEARYVDRILHALFLSFRDFDLFHATHRIWRMGHVAGTAGLSEPSADGGPSDLACMWGMADPRFRELVDKTLALLKSGCDSAESVEKLDGFAREYDRLGVLNSPAIRNRAAGIYLTTLQHFRWNARQQNDAGASGELTRFKLVPAIALRLWHVLRSLTRPGAHRRVPASANALRLLARHVRIAILGR